MSTSANFDLGQFLDVEFFRTRKREKKKTKIGEETVGVGQSISPCLCEGEAGDAFTETRLMPAFRV